MNWTIIIIETIVMTVAFTAMVLIPLVKNPSKSKNLQNLQTLIEAVALEKQLKRQEKPIFKAFNR